MKLDIDLSGFYTLIRELGIKELPIIYLKKLSDIPEMAIYAPVDIYGKLEDIKFEEKTGLATVNGQQVVLYIDDHGYRVLEAVKVGLKGNRYHVINCRTLKEMNLKGKLDKYRQLSDPTDYFPIKGIDTMKNKEIHRTTRLHICKNCLTALNYKGYACRESKEKIDIFNKFDIKNFFENYSSCFEYQSYSTNSFSVNYTPDWEKVSKKTRQERNYTCEHCHINLVVTVHRLATLHQ